MKTEAYKKRETELKVEYENFLKTKGGQDWKKEWTERYTDHKDIKDAGCFGDYLYDFYIEMLV